ncbi:MAG: DUF1501 domain-containing protein [Planctomycetia bacterium]|nr:DUF1501 domain-containing protein [Planctomycetia bacterium]
MPRDDGNSGQKYSTTPRASRRDVLKWGGVSLLSGGLMNVLAGRAAAASRKARIKSCLFLFQAGGVSQIDTFDMKPDADITIRGEFRPIDSNVPGMPVCELLPRMARQMDKVCVVRSVHHRMLCHNPAIYAALSGREVGESLAVSNKTFASREDYPHVGAIVSRLIEKPAALPSAVSLPFTLRNGPAPSPGQHAGFLGTAHDPYLVLRDPSSDDFRLDELEFPAEMNLDRASGRKSLLERFDAGLRRLEETAAVEALGENYRRAYGLLDSSATRRAFDLSAESDALRDRYGRNLVGQSTLLGRRLIEAGVPFVTVYTPVAAIDGPSWDTHLDNFPRLKKELLPPVDLALPTLLEDMHARGLLDETLVVWAGEFGRTPLIGARRSNNGNNVTGRDHWPGCYTILLAGGGVFGGKYFGASDRLGWYPRENPIHIADLTATILAAFGIDPAQVVPDTLGRPHVISEGHAVPGLLS